MCFMSLLQLISLRFIWLWTHHRLGYGRSYAWQEPIPDGDWGFSSKCWLICRTFDILAAVNTFWNCQHALLVEYVVLNPACDLRVQWMAALVMYMKQAAQTTDGLSALLFSNTVSEKEKHPSSVFYYGCSHTWTVFLCSETDDLIDTSLGLFCVHTALLRIIIKRAEAHTFTFSLQPYITASCVLVVFCIVGQDHLSKDNESRVKEVKCHIELWARAQFMKWWVNKWKRRGGGACQGEQIKAVASSCWVGCVLTANEPL